MTFQNYVFVFGVRTQELIHFSNLRKVRAMSLRDLLRREQQVKNNIWRVQSEMKKNPDSRLTQARIDRLRGYQAELAEIQRQLGDE